MAKTEKEPGNTIINLIHFLQKQDYTNLNIIIKTFLCKHS